MDATFEQTMTLVTTYGLRVLGALAVLIIGWIIAGWAGRWTAKGLAKTSKVDETLRGFLSSLVRYIILIFTGVAVLNLFSESVPH